MRTRYRTRESRRQCWHVELLFSLRWMLLPVEKARRSWGGNCSALAQTVQRRHFHRAGWHQLKEARMMAGVLVAAGQWQLGRVRSAPMMRWRRDTRRAGKSIRHKRRNKQIICRGAVNEPRVKLSLFLRQGRRRGREEDLDGGSKAGHVKC